LRVANLQANFSENTKFYTALRRFYRLWFETRNLQLSFEFLALLFLSHGVAPHWRTGALARPGVAPILSILIFD